MSSGKSRIYALIMAGGSGTRMSGAERPKQFLELAGKPVIIHTVEKFIGISRIDAVTVLVPAGWTEETAELISRWLPSASVAVSAGGSDRSATLIRGIDYIEETYGLDEDTVVVTHDAVRPFVSAGMIEASIEAALECGCCTAAVPSTDTVMLSADGAFVDKLPDRALMYLEQTPQTFRAMKFRELFGSLSADERAGLTDACRVFLMRGERVRLIPGSRRNIKLTYPEDLLIAGVMMGSGDNGEGPAE